MKGGNPTLDAKKYWNSVRRALLREPVDRIGLGGYLHLVEKFPDFCDYIEKISDEFREIGNCHKEGRPYRFRTRVAVLHSWGRLRSWTLSGHFHETCMHDLIHVNEALSGLPVEVSFIDFEDIKNGALDNADVVINAGKAGTAWSGGDHWKNDTVVVLLTKWVYEGGCFIGVNEPSAVEGYDTFFRMAHVLGVDEDTGAKISHGKWSFPTEVIEGLLPEGCFVNEKENRYLTEEKAKVLLSHDGMPDLTINDFGRGKGIYLGGFKLCSENTRMLFNLILLAGNEDLKGMYLTDNPYTECAYYPNSKKLIIINNSGYIQEATVHMLEKDVQVQLEAYDSAVVNVSSETVR